MEGDGNLHVEARLVSGSRLEMAVRDEGPGFTQTALERGIDPFFTTKARGDGSGLGLTMVYDFTKQSGGRVHLENTDTGAHVVMSLPLQDPPVASDPGLILLVEDTPEIRVDVREMLREQGHSVLEANTGEEALELAKLPNVSQILTDIMLGGDMTGLDLAMQLETSGLNLPIRMITGLPKSDPIRQQAEARYQILRKPFSTQELSAFLEHPGS